MRNQSDYSEQKFLAVLAQERAILKSGEFYKLEALVKFKSDALQFLTTTPAGNPKNWQVVQDNLRRNQDLIQASLNGIQQATKRIHEFEKIQASLTTYNLNGELRTVATETGKNLERKA